MSDPGVSRKPSHSPFPNYCKVLTAKSRQELETTTWYIKLKALYLFQGDCSIESYVVVPSHVSHRPRASSAATAHQLTADLTGPHVSSRSLIKCSNDRGVLSIGLTLHKSSHVH